MLFDTHAHYYDQAFDGDRDAVLASLAEANVGLVLVPGCDLASSRQAIELAERWPFVYAAVGVHPEDALGLPADWLAQVEGLAQHPKVKAIGEIGLDYYWKEVPHDLQQEVFAAQLALAERLDLPVIVHDREAHADTLELLKKYRPKGVVHSFSGSAEMAKEILNLGMYIGIGGVLTFKNAKKLPEIATALPSDRFLLETDAPYLAPVPYRSKINNSVLILLVAEKLAELRNTDCESILKESRYNAEKLFGI